MELQNAAEILSERLGTYESNLKELMSLADGMVNSTTLSYEFVVNKIYCMASVGRNLVEIKQIVSAWM